MPTYTKVLLSGSTNGRVIPVVATSTPGTLIHTAHATALDEVYLWATNVSISDSTITLQWGGVTAPGDNIVSAYNIPALSQIVLICPGICLTSSLVVRCWSTAASSVNVYGYVNRIT